MAVAASNEENAGHGSYICGFHWPEKVLELARKAKKVGEDDPRRIVHSLKAGLAVTLVSLLYYTETVRSSLGENTAWAIMTSVVIFEFSVGATLGKGVNRMLATVGAGVLGLGVHVLATYCGEIGKPILVNLFIFLTAAMVSFARFFPRLKARCDYGLMIFILTFCLVSVSDYQEENIPKMVFQRLSTITVGCCITLLVNICIFPVWIGEDLHNLVALNMEKLAEFLEEFGVAYFEASQEGLPSNRASLQQYKSVLTSQSCEENMANLARWEPGHGRFRFDHPWKQYLKIGTLVRQCSIKIDALDNYLDSEIQTPSEIPHKIQEECMKISLECSKAIKELSSSIKMMTQIESPHFHIRKSKTASENLKSQLNTKTGLWEEIGLLQVAPATAVASLLLEVLQCTERIADAVDELASLASFKSIEPSASQEQNQGSSQLMHSINIHNHEITIGE